MNEDRVPRKHGPACAADCKGLNKITAFDREADIRVGTVEANALATAAENLFVRIGLWSNCPLVRPDLYIDIRRHRYRDVRSCRMKTILHAAVTALVLSALGPVGARGQASPAEKPEAESSAAATLEKNLWSFRVSPYVWFARLSGDVGVGANLPVINVDADFSDIFESIDWFPPPVMVVGEVRYRRFAFVTDFIYLGLEEDHERTAGPESFAAEVDLNTTIWTFGGSFRAVETTPLTIDLLAGGRLWSVDAKGKLTGPLAVRQRSGNQTWVDPIIGIIGRIDLGNGFALQAEGDVGGFGATSDVDWQVLGKLQYAINETFAVEAGYRYLSVDHKNGGFLFDVALQGPIIGGSLQF
jgi:opacity protein-like surface antigen